MAKNSSTAAPAVLPEDPQELKAIVEKKDSIIADQEKALASLNEKLSAETSLRKEVEAEHTAAVKRIQELEEKLAVPGTANSEIDTLKQQMAGVCEDLSKTKTDLDIANARVAELEKDLQEAEVKTPEEKTFEYDGKRYKVNIPKVKIPGLGLRTASEICADQEAKAYLIKSCIGSIITEVIE